MAHPSLFLGALGIGALFASGITLAAERGRVAAFLFGAGTVLLALAFGIWT